MKDIEQLISRLYPKPKMVGGMTLEDEKQIIRSIYVDASGWEMERTPTFYFLRCVSGELQKQKVDREYHDPLLRDMQVTLTGLGLDYEPHKEWLDEMAELVVKTAQKIIAAMQPEFSDEVIIAQFSKLGIVLP